jgi:probable rRNA maturation factor
MVLNRQRRVRVSMRELDRFLGRVSKLLHLPVDSVTVCLVTNSEIARWNRDYRGKDRPTDVLSFQASDSGVESRGNGSRNAAKSRGGRKPVARSISDDTHAAYLGDIAIAPSVARRNARQFGRTFGDEMRILILHGMLHLMGYDHETDSGQMERREQRLRRVLGLA